MQTPTENILNDKSLIIPSIHRARKGGGAGWWEWIGEFIDHKGTGHPIRIKGYGTWMQLFTIDGVKHWSTPDCKVKDMTIDLEKALDTLPA